jgi:O-antigen ligase
MYETLIWTVPLIVLLAGLWWPRAGLLVLAATLPLFAAPPGGPYLAALDVSVLAAVVTGLRGGKSRPSSLDQGVMMLVAVAAAAMFPLAYQPPSWSPGVVTKLLAYLPEVERWTILFTWREMTNVLLGVGIYVAVKRAFGRGGAVALGRAMGVGLLGTMMVGYLEIAGWIDLWTFRPIGAPIFEHRFHGTFFHSGWLAEFLVLATPMAIAAWGGDSMKRKIIGLAILIFASGALFLSGQRGGWLAASAQLVLAALLLRRQNSGGRLIPRLIGGTIAIAVLGILLVGVSSTRPEVGATLKERVSRLTSDLSGRTIIWKTTLDVATERPLLGWGPGSFSPAFDRAVSGEDATPVPGRAIRGHHHAWLTAHNTYLMMFAERGLMGVTSLAILGLFLWLVVRRAIRNADARTRNVALGVVVTATGFAVYGLVQYMFFPRAIGFLVWMILGIAAVVDHGRAPRRVETTARILTVGVLVLLPVRALFWEPAPARGSRSFGFHAPEFAETEVPFQWTAAKTAMRQIPWEDEVLRFRVANGHPKAAERPIFVEILVDGVVVDQIVADGGWEESSVFLGKPVKQTVVLGVSVDRTFRPFSEYRMYPDLEDSRDIRSLGVAMGEISWEKSRSPIRLKMPDQD